MAEKRRLYSSEDRALALIEEIAMETDASEPDQAKRALAQIQGVIMEYLTEYNAREAYARKIKEEADGKAESV